MSCRLFGSSSILIDDEICGSIFCPQRSSAIRLELHRLSETHSNECSGMMASMSICLKRRLIRLLYCSSNSCFRAIAGERRDVMFNVSCFRFLAVLSLLSRRERSIAVWTHTARDWPFWLKRRAEKPAPRRYQDNIFVPPHSYGT